MRQLLSIALLFLVSLRLIGGAGNYFAENENRFANEALAENVYSFSGSRLPASPFCKTDNPSNTHNSYESFSLLKPKTRFQLFTTPPCFYFQKFRFTRVEKRRTNYSDTDLSPPHYNLA
ncbi:MAG: hypothetical protein JXB34_13685 [Bacteroidales bacterium]|nr:hypothetical protein [Bacteroidales bacterium]